MAAPEYVPQEPNRLLRRYTSPPRRPESWRPQRPGDLPGRQPQGDRLGVQGPDQGYIGILARQLQGGLHLAEGEHERDALAGAQAVALKRASLFGRAPVIHDLTVALTVWGFLDPSPPADLVELRRRLFEEVSHPHHYAELRHIVDLVPESTLRMAPAEVNVAHRGDWRALLERGSLDPVT